MNLFNFFVDWLLDSFEVDISLFYVGCYCGGWYVFIYGLVCVSFYLVV